MRDQMARGKMLFKMILAAIVIAAILMGALVTEAQEPTPGLSETLTALESPLFSPLPTPGYRAPSNVELANMGADGESTVALYAAAFALMAIGGFYLLLSLDD